MRAIEAGLLVDGHDATRADVLARTRTYLLVSHHHLDVDEALATARVSRAWWGGEKVGFVQEGHPDAQPVTVVNIGLSTP